MSRVIQSIMEHIDHSPNLPAPGQPWISLAVLNSTYQMSRRAMDGACAAPGLRWLRTAAAGGPRRCVRAGYFLFSSLPFLLRLAVGDCDSQSAALNCQTWHICRLGISNLFGIANIRAIDQLNATMRFTEAIAALVLLATAVAGAEYVPLHKRFSYDVAVNDFSYLGMLSKRDSCSDAFGSNAHNSNCAPDFTLCCTRDRQDYPSCERHLGLGWCCVGANKTDKCYVDHASVCSEDSSVACTNLQAGTDQACCPKLTTCDPNTKASEQFVRCNINRGDLLVAAQASEDATSTTATSTEASSSTEAASKTRLTSTTASEAKTATAESQTAGPTETSNSSSSSSSSISGGAIGGIVVAVVAGIAVVAFLIWFFMRRSKKAKYEAAHQTPQQLSIPQYYDDQQQKYQQQGYYPDGQGGYVHSPPQPPSELADQRPPVELDAGMVDHQQQRPQS
ncbi:hypothetical protein G7046_g127 [Stylonectria norvegica]|nr:hypothetical protein G7046_g127 [Stylonectria norvegica]